MKIRKYLVMAAGAALLTALSVAPSVAQEKKAAKA